MARLSRDDHEAQLRFHLEHIAAGCGGAEGHDFAAAILARTMTMESIRINTTKGQLYGHALRDPGQSEGR